MSDNDPQQDAVNRLPTDIPIIHGPITPAEQKADEKRQRRKARNDAQNAFKERQVAAIEAANKLSSRSVVLTIIVAVISLGACIGTWFQGCANARSWQTARDTLTQMQRESKTSSDQFQVQLGHFDAGLGRSDNLAIHAGEQAIAGRDSADAAKSAANTARETLHVSEMAYIRLQEPRLNFADRSLALPISNSGHLPSKHMEETIHQGIWTSENPSYFKLDSPDEKKWQTTKWYAIVPGTHNETVIPFPLLNEAEYNLGKQMIVVSGSISYNDGFDGTAAQTWDFCFRSTFHLTIKKNFIVVCDPNEWTPRLIKLDGYPKNETTN